MSDAIGCRSRAPARGLAAYRLDVLFVVQLGLLLGSPLAADTIELVADRDNTLYESETGTISNGVGIYLFVGNTAQEATADTRRGLVRFDVAGALPAGATITAATLSLYCSKAPETTSFDITLRRVGADWGEGSSNDTGQEGSGAAATTNDATWQHRFYSTLFWTADGGDFAAGASATTAVGSDGATYAWSGAGAVADVQAWLDDPTSNFGWLLRGDESSARTVKRFNTHEDISSSGTRRPKLSITFTPPATTGACCAASGDCAVIEPLTCSAQSGTYQGNGSSCTPNPCPQPAGACCFGDATCQSLTAADCSTGGGTFQGGATLCGEVTCPLVLGACCLPGAPGSCEERNSVSCASDGGSFLGELTECGIDLCPFVDPLPLPAVATPASGTPGAAAHYEIAITETVQQLHRDLVAPTRVWTYAGSYPGPTIEAAAGEPVEVEWLNDLRDESAALRTEHLLPVDSCVHGAESNAARVVTHLHGGHDAAASDGYPEATLLPGESVLYDYPNDQLPATLWYHDHALGITRLNVYLGLAGFYLLRDPFETALGLPAGEFELPLAIQDRSFLADGALDYPASWDEHFFGDTILVNGKVWPYLEVKRGKYRFRLLAGSNSRTFRLSLSDGATFHQIGTDGGLLPAPVPLTEVTLSPGERADLVLDFAPYPAGTVLHLVNDAPAPFPGSPGVGVVADVLELRVGSESGHTAPLPATLRVLEPLLEADATVERTFELRKYSEACAGAMWMINGLEWDEITERPTLGDTELWSFVNRSGTVHPMHLHLSMFQILDRQPFEIVDDQVVPTGPRLPPAANEAGWKDTVAVNPFEIVRILVKFEDFAGLFPYHCHMLEHEDHEMMRQLETRPRGIFADGFDDDGVCPWSVAIGGPPCGGG